MTISTPPRRRSPVAERVALVAALALSIGAHSTSIAAASLLDRAAVVRPLGRAGDAQADVIVEVNASDPPERTHGQLGKIQGALGDAPAPGSLDDSGPAPTLDAAPPPQVHDDPVDGRTDIAEPALSAAAPRPSASTPLPTATAIPSAPSTRALPVATTPPRSAPTGQGSAAPAAPPGATGTATTNPGEHGEGGGFNDAPSVARLFNEQLALHTDMLAGWQALSVGPIGEIEVLISIDADRKLASCAASVTTPKILADATASACFYLRAKGPFGSPESGAGNLKLKLRGTTTDPAAAPADGASLKRIEKGPVGDHYRASITFDDGRRVELLVFIEH